MTQSPVAVYNLLNINKKLKQKTFNAKFDRCLVKQIIYFVLYVCKR